MMRLTLEIQLNENRKKTENRVDSDFEPQFRVHFDSWFVFFCDSNSVPFRIGIDSLWCFFGSNRFHLILIFTPSNLFHLGQESKITGFGASLDTIINSEILRVIDVNYTSYYLYYFPFGLGLRKSRLDIVRFRFIKN